MSVFEFVNRIRKPLFVYTLAYTTANETRDTPRRKGARKRLQQSAMEIDDLIREYMKDLT